MKKLVVLSGGAMCLLSACVSPVDIGGDPSLRGLGKVPENVRAIAAPYQDLSDVRINKADGCFVYRHKGPVETTYLPLRAAKGQPICTKRDKPAEEPAAT